MQLIYIVILSLFVTACSSNSVDSDSRQLEDFSEVARDQKDFIINNQVLDRQVLPEQKPAKRESIVSEVMDVRDDVPTDLPQESPLQPIDYPVTLNVKNASLGSVIQLFARTAGYSLFESSGVQAKANEKITLNLNAIPWEMAFELVKERGQLRAVFDDHHRLMRLYTESEYETLVTALYDQRLKETEKIEKLRLVSSVDPRQPRLIERIYLRFIKPDKAAEELKKELAALYGVEESSPFLPIISEDVDPASLLIRGSKAQLADARLLLDQIDRLPKQVIIEAFFVEVSENFEKELGVRLSGKTGSSKIGVGLNPTADGENELPDAELFDFLPNAGQAFTVVSGVGSGLLRLELQALQADGFSRTVSSPKILATSGEESRIKREIETFFRGQGSVADNGTSTDGAVESIKAGLSLTMKPEVVGDYVHMEVDLRNDAFVGSATTDVPPDKSIVEVSIPRLILRTGEIVVIGGVASLNESVDNQKVPGLSELPGAGKLFQGVEEGDSRTQLLVFIAPRII